MRVPSAPRTPHPRLAAVTSAGAVLRSMRPKQWVKNLLVVAAPLAAGDLGEPGVLGADGARLRLLLPGVLGDLPGQRLRRRRGRPAAPAQAVPADRRRRAVGPGRARGRGRPARRGQLAVAFAARPEFAGPARRLHRGDGPLLALAQARAGDRPGAGRGRLPDAGGRRRPGRRHRRSPTGSCWSPASARCSSSPASATPSCTRSAARPAPAARWCATPTPTCASCGASRRPSPSRRTACGPSRTRTERRRPVAHALDHPVRGRPAALRRRHRRGPAAEPEDIVWRDRVLQGIGVRVARGARAGGAECLSSPRCSPAGDVRRRRAGRGPASAGPRRGRRTCVRARRPRGLIARGLGRSYGDPAQNAGGVVLDAAAGRHRPSSAADGTVRVSRGHQPARPDARPAAARPVRAGHARAPATSRSAARSPATCTARATTSTGSFGDHVRLARPGARRTAAPRTVGPDRDAELFWATVGGMGLTGIVTRPRSSTRSRSRPAYADVTTQRLARPRRGDARDGARPTTTSPTPSPGSTPLARGGALGRSVLSRGEHATRDQLPGRAAARPAGRRRRRRGWPCRSRRRSTWSPDRPSARSTRRGSARRRGTATARSSRSAPSSTRSTGSARWNRLYGPHGFVQYQFVVPDDQGDALVADPRADLRGPAARRFLAVLKRFGPGNAGPLSFPMAGWTLAFDVPAHPGLAPLLDSLDAQVVAAGGRVYLAKDSRLRRRAAAGDVPAARRVPGRARAGRPDAVPSSPTSPAASTL